MKTYALALAVAGLIAGLTGCQSATAPQAAFSAPLPEITLHPEDVIRVTFPGAPNLDTGDVPIRSDGKITIPVAGEMTAGGLTPTQLQQAILTKIGSQLVTQEVLVTVVRTQFSVYIDGPVQRPGKIVSDHPLTVLDAIMEAGGFDYKNANTSRVVVIRQQAGGNSYYTVNVKRMLNGSDKQAFYLQSGDIIHVSQKLAWF